MLTRLDEPEYDAETEALSRPLKEAMVDVGERLRAVLNGETGLKKFDMWELVEATRYMREELHQMDALYLKFLQHRAEFKPVRYVRKEKP